jgi:hypothetical protein
VPNSGWIIGKLEENVKGGWKGGTFGSLEPIRGSLGFLFRSLQKTSWRPKFKRFSTGRDRIRGSLYPTHLFAGKNKGNIQNG